MNAGMSVMLLADRSCEPATPLYRHIIAQPDAVSQAQLCTDAIISVMRIAV